MKDINEKIKYPKGLSKESLIKLRDYVLNNCNSNFFYGLCNVIEHLDVSNKESKLLVEFFEMNSPGETYIDSGRLINDMSFFWWPASSLHKQDRVDWMNKAIEDYKK